MFLYAIGTSGSRQKIGYSNDPEARLKSLQTGNPENLILHYSFQIDESIARKFEMHVHHQHSHKRLKGEWFNMTVSEVIDMMQYHEIMKETIIATF